jgi:phospholipid transport system substrate-binding protein
MRTSTILFAGALLVCGALQSSAWADQAQSASPGSATQSNDSQNAAQSMLKALDADRQTYRKDPPKVQQLVDKYLLPHFDTELSARLVLGPHWRTATPEQRQRFIDAFYHSLLSNYGTALTDFTADKLKVFPSNVAPTDTKATVRTEVKRDNGDRVSVNYYLHKTPEGWKAWDVSIDGISYVNSYRQDFGSQIDQQGLDAVISRLERGEKPSEINKTTGGKGKAS